MIGFYGYMLLRHDDKLWIDEAVHTDTLEEALAYREEMPWMKGPIFGLVRVAEGLE